MNFLSATAKDFVDDGTGWPTKGSLILDGFRFEAFGPGYSCQRALDWLRLQPTEPFYTQPYEQVIEVFKRAGREHDAREIAIAKEDDFRKFGNPSRPHRLWLWFIRWTIRYGYKPWWVSLPILFSLAFAWMIFDSGYHNGLMHPSKERVFIHDCYVGSQSDCPAWETITPLWAGEHFHIPADYPKFEPLAFAADTFFPFINLHQEEYWLPKADGWGRGGWLRGYMWFNIAIGWILSTIAVLGFTGVIKKD